MSDPSSDRNLLLGVLALQLDFIDREQLVAAMNAWMMRKSRSLGGILREQGDLREDEYHLVCALVEKHLERHDDDSAKSLGALSLISSVRRDLEQIADPIVQQSLTIVSRDHEYEDLDATTPHSVGVGTSQGHRFSIVRPYAEGGLGKISVAIDEELSREVALKELKAVHATDSESRARFLLEAEITGRLEHPGVVPVYGLGRYRDGRPFYVMPLVRGENLQEAIRRLHEADRRGERIDWHSLAFRRLLGRFVAACTAVHYAHCRGVLHRDLKPSNILLGKYGETLVIDWGLAKASGSPEELADTEEDGVLRPTSSGVAATWMGRALGTPGFMSPEQAEGQLDQMGRASDVYGLGATLYCLLTGQPPFEGHNLAEVLARVRTGDFPPPQDVNSRVPRSLEAICLKAMALNPEDRHESVAALADDCEHWLADEPVSAYEEPTHERMARRLRGQGISVRAFTIAVLVLTLAMGSCGYFIAYRAWFATRDEAEKLTALQATLALEFDLAIREYATDFIRPEMAKRIGDDEFVVEAMSPSFIARSVFEKVHEKFPDYVIKFPSDNPRDPENLAGPAELKLLKYFQENPGESRWSGKIEMNGREYLACLSAMRIEQRCLKCHGRPEDAPQSLIERYGNTGSFHRQVGDVAGMDMIAIPMDKVNSAIAAEAMDNVLFTSLWLTITFTTVVITFRLLITSRQKREVES